MKKSLAAVLIVVILVALSGCAAAVSSRNGYPGFDTPKATLSTFFASRMKHDFETTWLCYYKHYGDKVAKTEFLKHSKQDPTTLVGFEIRSVEASGTSSAIAQVSLKFKTNDPKRASRQVVVNEQLVKESGQWRIKVW